MSLTRISLAVLLVSACCLSMAAAARLTSVQRMQSCESRFIVEMHHSSGHAGLECGAFKALSECIQKAFTNAGKDSLGAIQFANDVIARAVTRATACELTTVGLLQSPSSAETPKRQRTARAVMTLFEMAERVKNLRMFRKEFYDQVGGSLDSTFEALDEFATVTQDTIETLFAANVENLNARLDAAAAEFNSAAAISAALDTQSNSMTAAVSSMVSVEQTALASASTSVSSMVGTLSTTVANGINQAANDRTAMRSTMTATSPGVVVMAEISTQAANEVTRETAMATARASTLAKRRLDDATFTSTASTNEYNRFNTYCTAQKSSLGFGFPEWSGSLDDATCSTSERGKAYYSQQYQTLYVCTGAFYTPIIADLARNAFPSSKIISSNFGAQLSNFFGTDSRWMRCYSASIDGYSGSTFHTKCAGKDNQLVVMQENSGRLFGGFTDQSFTNQSPGWRSYIYGARTWRFDKETSRLDVLFPYQYQSYTLYDTNSYGPCFGYGGGNFDIYVSSNIKNTYVGRSGYWTFYNYRVGFSPCTGCGYSALYSNSYSSLTLSDLEVYYRV